MPEFTLASYNCRWGLSRFGARRGRRFDVAEVVRSFDADVVVLVEAWRPHERGGEDDPLTALAAEGWQVEELRFVTLRLRQRPQVASPGEGWWELAVLSRLPMTGRRELPIGRVPHDPAGSRHALQVTLDVHGTALDLVAVHASSKLWYGGPVRHLSRLRRSLPDRQRPAVVAGDFNLWGPGVSLLLPGWRRTVRGRTYPSHRPHSQIDHILVSRTVEPLDVAVLPDDLSDHRPVRARLRI